MSENNGFVTAAILDELAGLRTFDTVATAYGTFRLKSWLGTEREAYLKLGEKKNSEQRTAAAIVMSVVDGEGEAVFPAEAAVIDKIASWPMSVLQPLEKKILRMNGLDIDIEELAGNSKAATSGDSGSS